MRKIFFIIILLATTLIAKGQETALTLENYKERVLDYSRQLAKSKEYSEAIKQSVKYAKTQMLPRIDFSSSMQYSLVDNGFDFAGQTLSFARENYSLVGSASQVIYGGGRYSSLYKAAQVEDSIATNSVAYTQQELLYAAEVSYWNASAQKAIYDAMNHYVEIVEKFVSVIKLKYEDGYIAKNDYLQAQTNLEEAKITRSNILKSYRKALVSMNIMMGNAPLTELSLSEPIETEQPLLTNIELPEVLKNRYDYKISQFDVQYQELQLKTIKSGFNPQLSVGVNAAWGTSALNFDGSTLFSPAVYASLNIPIFAWGARHKQTRAQKSIIKTKELDQSALSDAISQQLAEAWIDYTENRVQISIAKRSVDVSTQSMNINMFSYDEGRLTILDVLTSQAKWIGAQTNYISALLNEKYARATYLKAASRY